MRLLAGGLQDELLLLRYRQARFQGQPLSRADHQPDSQHSPGTAERARTDDAAHERSLHGNGRAARQPPRTPQGDRNPHRPVGPGMEPEAHHRLHRGQTAAAQGVARPHAGTRGAERTHGRPAATRVHDAGAEGFPPDGRHETPLGLRLRPPAPPVARIHNVAQRQRRHRTRRPAH